MVALGLCVGLALEGKIPVFYSISTFAIYRPFEVIRNYLHHEQISVKIVGSGQDKDYEKDGYSHWDLESRDILKHLKIKTYYPDLALVDDMNKLFREFLYNGKPSFMALKK
jgi:transketolase C-terminal domain/subunit